MQMGAHEVWDIVSNMKQLVESEPEKAKQMFVSHPQVKYDIEKETCPRYLDTTCDTPKLV